MANVFDALGKLDSKLRGTGAQLENFIMLMEKNAQRGDDLSKLVLGFVHDVETGARRADEAVIAFGDMQTQLTGTRRNLGQVLSELLKDVEQTSQRTRQAVTDSEQALERLRAIKDPIAQDIVEMTENLKKGKGDADFYLQQLQEVAKTFHGELGQLAEELANAYRQSQRAGARGAGGGSGGSSLGPQTGGVAGAGSSTSGSGGIKGGGSSGGGIGTGSGSGSGGINTGGSASNIDAWNQPVHQAQDPWDSNLVAASRQATQSAVASAAASQTAANTMEAINKQLTKVLAQLNAATNGGRGGSGDGGYYDMQRADTQGKFANSGGIG